MTTDYDAEDAFEQYLCFSAMLSQRLKTATDELEQLDERDDPEYVRAVVQKVMKPLCDLMEYRIRTYPYSSENIAGMKAICGAQAEEFISAQKEIFEEYYTLLPLVKTKEESETAWKEVEAKFDAVLASLN
ncbi:MAG TPA: hypothetical protein O0W79_02215 [Methanocorpusculum sp.]|nr:hypothetical protein [Methanocorpusculum sp.]